MGRIFAHAYFHHREAFEQAEAESSLYARFLTLTERFDLVPAEFLVIPSTIDIGESLGSRPSRSTRDENRRSTEFDRGYHQMQQQQEQQEQQQERSRYDLDLANFHHPNFPERDPSPPGPSSSSESNLGGIGESPSPSSRARIGRTRTGTMVFAEAEANAVTDELASRTSLREREPEPQKIELLERDMEPVPLKTVIPATTVANEEEDVQLDLSLSSEIGKSGEEGSSVVPSEVIEEESPGPVEVHEPPPLLEPEETRDTEEIAVPPPSAPAEPEANVSIPHSSTEEEEPAEQTVSSIIEVIKTDDSLETTEPILPTETTTDLPPVNDNEPALIPEVAVVSQEVATKADDKETIDDSELPTIEAPVAEA